MRIVVIGKGITAGSLARDRSISSLPEVYCSAVGIICAQPSLDMYRTSEFRS
jgi:hypothetical protein